MESAARMSVLVVDDDPGMLETIGSLLASEYRVLVASSAESALALATTQPVDLILLDVIMPDMDGYALCGALKSHEGTREIPVIFVTAKSEQQFEAVGFELGGVDYITKPVNPAILRLRVRNHLELKRKSDQLRALSQRDGLTGLANRRRMDQMLEQEWRQAIRRGNSWLAVLLLDVDFFKLYNDHYGHQAGDECLRQVAMTLQSVLTRSTDLAARYGGEEFCCILPETPANGAVAVAEEIRNRIWHLAIPHARSTVADRVTVSIGVAAMRPVQTRTQLQLLEEADTLLYGAKQGGRNRSLAQATV
ncbi:MAG: PleD family two-component system response regulator [Magnetococcales bacterium]|nr:PleD family two-component system response regulator [Magnetococcales bacterium]